MAREFPARFGPWLLLHGGGSQRVLRICSGGDVPGPWVAPEAGTSHLTQEVVSGLKGK